MGGEKGNGHKRCVPFWLKAFHNREEWKSFPALPARESWGWDSGVTLEYREGIHEGSTVRSC